MKNNIKSNISNNITFYISNNVRNDFRIKKLVITILVMLQVFSYFKVFNI